ncbi:MAG: nuclear transport factor 2 family protein [Kofleriaceae bacterium]
MRTLVVALGVAVGGCAAAPAAEVQAPRRERGDAVAETRGLIDEAYQALRIGKPTNLMGLLAPDVFFIGPGPDQVGLDRTDALALGRDLIDTRRQKHKLRSRRLEVIAGPDGRTAYAFDQLAYDGADLAVTAVATELDGLWSLTMVAVLPAVGKRGLDRGVAPGALPGWTPPPGRHAAHADAPREILAALAVAADDVEARLQQLGDEPDGAFVGPVVDAVAIGPKRLRKAWKQLAPRWTVAASLGGASPDGGLVWVVGNAAVVPPPVRAKRATRDRAVAPPVEPAAPTSAGAPRRLLALYRRDGAAAAGWRLVLLNEAIVLAP